MIDDLNFATKYNIKTLTDIIRYFNEKIVKAPSEYINPFICRLVIDRLVKDAFKNGDIITINADDEDKIIKTVVDKAKEVMNLTTVFIKKGESIDIQKTPID